MLSRVAESLYWMSRHAERAENLLRIIDVNHQLLLDVPSRQGRELAMNWLPVVTCLGDERTFRSRKLGADDRSVTEFLVFDHSHANSVAGCLAAARENARTIREHLSNEMWEQINRTHLWFSSKAARASFDRNRYEFIQRTKKSLQLFQGITDTTMLHGEGYEFIQIGKHLERADKTSRLLDEKYHLLQQGKSSPNDLLLQWLAVLRGCSARHIYQRIYASAVEPIRVAELLTLNEALPRSIRFCALQVDLALRRISGVPPGRYSNEAEKLSGRLTSELSFSSIEDICAPGLHRAMDEVQVQLNSIGAAIVGAYLHHTQPAILEPRLLPQAAQPPQ